MISIDLGTHEYYDSDKGEFIYDECGIVEFEYSLEAIYKWEAKWKKPFLKGERTDDELLDFYVTMALTPIDKKFITYDVMLELANYITESQTATTFSSHSGQNGDNGTSKAKVYTAEEIYALMFMHGIDLEFEKRNLDRLLTVIRIMGSYNTEPKKMDKEDILKQNALINAERRKKMNTKG